MDELKSIIAKNLIYYRTQAKMTQYEIAQKLNYSDKSISKWERGAGIPDIFILKQLADILEINYEKLKNYCFDIMYKCEWCPYIVVIADRGLINEIFEILETSREKSKRQQQRIDKAVISYCTDARIKQIKSKWKNADLDGKHFNKMINP